MFIMKAQANVEKTLEIEKILSEKRAKKSSKGVFFSRNING